MKWLYDNIRFTELCKLNSVTLIKSGGGKCPTKPGNRHVYEMVPNHTKQMLWEMREWISSIEIENLLPFCSFAEGIFYFKGKVRFT